MRRIAVVTVGRSDWGIYRPVLRRLAAVLDVELQILASGAHLDPRVGTIAAVEEDGFGAVVRLPIPGGDSGREVADAMGRATSAFAVAFAEYRPDLIVVLGDRFEMFAAASAAVPLVIPLAHIHGGERTAGAIDDVFRHAMTKMSHLHFASTNEFARRVRQLGEEAWRVTVSGAPALDEIHRLTPMSPAELRQQFGVDVETPFALCTFHPTTLEPGAEGNQVDALVDALATFGLRVVFTGPNADAGGQLLRKRIGDACVTNPLWQLVESFGARGWFSVMQRAAVVVGNSSSGIIEAPSFRVPVVNIGTRQDGRPRAINVVDVGNESASILAGLRRATSADFRGTLVDMKNPYGDGRAAERIVDVLCGVALDGRLKRKGFVDWSES